MSRKDNIPDDLSSWLDQETLHLDEGRQKSRYIKLALNFEDRRDAIPDWDIESYENLFETMSPEDELALEYVADNEIILDKYRLKTVNTGTVTGQNYLTRVWLDELLEKYLDVKKTNNI